MKRIRKLMPVNVYDIAKTQSYLRDMASKGYFLKKLTVFAYFEKGDPEETTYRLEPLMRKEERPDEEQLAHYHRYGWEYVCTVNKAFHIYKTNKEEYTEIHTDPIIQSYAFEYVNKNLKFSYAMSIVLWPLAVFMILFPMLVHSHPVLAAVKYGNITYQVMLLLLAFVSIKQVFSNRKKLNLLLNQLKSGAGMSQKSSYRPDYRPYIYNGLIMFFSALTILVSIFSFTARWERDLEEHHGRTPSIQLTDIEKDPGFEREMDLYKGNHIAYEWTELASGIYEIHERGVLPGQMWEDQSGEYSPSLRTEFFQLRVGFLAEPMFQELIDDETALYRHESMIYQELADTGFDRAVLIEVRELQMFFGILDKDVLSVRYHGYEDLAGHIDEMYDHVKSFQ